MTKKNDGRFSKENQPANKRGKGERTKIIDAMKAKGKTEQEFYELIVVKAFAEQDQFAQTEILKRLHTPLKSTYPMVEFELNTEGTPTQKANDLLKAVSNGDLSADMALALITAMNAALAIEEKTDMKADLEQIKEHLGLSDA